MFTIFSLFKSYAFDEQEHKITLLLLHAFRRHCPREGAFLYTLPFEQFKFKWCYRMTSNNGIMGAFNPAFRKTIFLQHNKNGYVEIIASKNPTIKYTWLMQLMPVMIHELTHAFQFQQAPIQYVVCSLPGLRQITLEKDVKTPEKAAKDFFDYLTDDISAIALRSVVKFMQNMEHDFKYKKTADKICYYMFHPELISFSDIIEMIKKDTEI